MYCNIRIVSGSLYSIRIKNLQRIQIQLRLRNTAKNKKNSPEIQLQMFDLAGQVLLHNPRDASIGDPVKLDLQGLVRRQERHFLFQSGGVVPKICITV